MPDELTLLPCPWCGNKEVYWTHSSDGEGGSAYVYCSDCDACGPQGKAYTKNGFSDEADQRWNTRVPDPALAAKDQRIAELEAKVAANSATPRGSCGWCAHSGGWRERWSPFGEVQQYGTCLHPGHAGIAVLGELSCDLFERKENS